MAEDVKIKIGSATKLKPSEVMALDVRGRDAFSGLPRTVKLTSEEVTDAIEDVLKKTADNFEERMSSKEIRGSLSKD